MPNLDLYEKGRPFAYRAYFRNDYASVTPLHWHEQIEILYAYTKNTHIQCGNTFYPMQPGDLVFVNSNQLHSIQGSNFAVIKFNRLFLPEIFEENTICKSIILGDPYITALFDNMRKEEYMYKNETSDIIVVGMIYDLLAHILNNYKLTPAETKMHLSKMNKSRKILAALDYIEENYQQKLSIDTLAGKCHLSKHYFCNLFKSQTGYSPTTYINHLRLQKSTKLLCTTNLSITDIANAVGFDDSSYFSMLFKKYYGKTPKIYKDEVQ